MVRIEEGDLLECDVSVIAHQVNCKGAFGAGLAGQIAERWPACKRSYENHVRAHNSGELLGTVLVWEGQEKTVVNLFGQDEPGPNTDDLVLYTAVQSLKDYMISDGIEVVALPWKIGCGIGGGDWDEIKHMIESLFSDVDRHLVWVRLR
jgi:O-acetyl-ADP-ribose deacetylase (regulator of RNase III)